MAKSVWDKRWGKQTPSTSLGEEWQPSHRERFEVFFISSHIGVIWNVWQAFISVVAFAIYVANTYYQPFSPTYEALYTVELVLTGFFIVDYLCHFYITANKFYWIWSVYGVIDMVSIVPVLAEAVIRSVASSSAGIQFLRALRVFRTIRLVRVFRVSKFASTELQKELVQWVLMVVCIVLVTTGIMQAVMLPEYNNDFNFNTALYYMVITLSTLGYGDITPKTELSRGLITLIVALAFPLAAYQTARLIYLRSLYDPRKGGLGKVPQRVHLVVTGSIHFTNTLALFREMFHPERQIRNISVCLLSSEPPDPELEWLLQHPFYRERVTFLIGNSLSPADLIRARADVARMVLVLGPPTAESVRPTDVETVMHYLSVRRALPDVRVAVQLLGWEDVPLVSPYDPVLSILDYKMGLLALSVRAPGFSTLLSNLMRTDTEPEEDAQHVVPSWHHKYLFGAGHELYTCLLSEAFEDYSYAEVANVLYDMFGVVMIGCRRKAVGVTQMLLSHTTIMKNGDAVFVLAQDDLVSRTLVHLRSVPLGTIEQQTPRSHVQRLISDGHIPQSIDRNRSVPQVRSTRSVQTLRSSSDPSTWAGSVPVEEALARDDPGPWRECYALERRPRPRDQVVVTTLPQEVEHHVCVVGPLGAVVRLLLRFRSLKTPSYCERAIVCMFDEEPSASVLHLMSWLPHVYFVQGSLLSQLDLNRIGLFTKAWSLVLVANPRRATLAMNSTEASTADADVICTLRNLYELASRYALRVMVCELAYGTNMRFLTFETHLRNLEAIQNEHNLGGGTMSFLQMLWKWRPSKNKSLTVEEINEKGHVNLPYHDSLFYCSGVAMPTGVVTCALANVIWNADVFDIASLLTGGVSLSSEQFRDAGEVFQWRVPVALVGNTYGTLYKLALGINCVCLGLFRSKQWEGPEPRIDKQGTLPGESPDIPPPPLREMLRRFVYTNPPKDEDLKDDDLVYVISRSERTVLSWNGLQEKGPALGGAMEAVQAAQARTSLVLPSRVSRARPPSQEKGVPLTRDDDDDDALEKESTPSEGWTEVMPHFGFASRRRPTAFKGQLPPPTWHSPRKDTQSAPPQPTKGKGKADVNDDFQDLELFDL